MWVEKQQSIADIVLYRIIGIGIFLIVVLVLNYLAGTGTYPVVSTMADFLNENVGLILLFSILFLFGEIFAALSFPLSLPGPVFNAFGGVFLVMFLLRILIFVDGLTGITLFGVLESLAQTFYLIVFFATLIGGYIGIFSPKIRRG
jgi:hypothetical protein